MEEPKTRTIELSPAVIEWAHEQTDHVFDNIGEVVVGVGFCNIKGSKDASYETGGMPPDLSACVTEGDNNG